jgi:hypothetical protein
MRQKAFECNKTQVGQYAGMSESTNSGMKEPGAGQSHGILNIMPDEI